MKLRVLVISLILVISYRAKTSQSIHRVAVSPSIMMNYWFCAPESEEGSESK